MIFDDDNEDEFDIEEDQEVDIEAIGFSDNNSFIDYGLHSKNGSYMNHYAMIKLRYKKLAFTWLIATFVAFGYIGEGAEAGLPFSNLSALIGLSFLASVGVYLLWFLDVRVYHRLLTSIFASNLLIEERDKKIDPTYHMMVKLLHGKKFDPVMSDASFYAIISSIILFVGNFALYQELINKFSQELALMIFFLMLGLIAACSIVFVYVAKSYGHTAFKSETTSVKNRHKK